MIEAIILLLFQLHFFTGLSQEDIFSSNSTTTEPQHDCDNHNNNTEKKIQTQCQCTTLWDSDCYCKNANFTALYYRPHRTSRQFLNSTLNGNTTCNCRRLWRECWNFNGSSRFYYSNCNAGRDGPVRMIHASLIISTSDSLYSIQIINVMKEALEFMGNNVSLQIYFNPLGIEKEKEIDTFLLCSIKHYPNYYQYFPFLACMVKFNYSSSISKEDFTMGCAKGHLLNYDIIENCSKSLEGRTLYEHNQKIAQNYPSQTLVVESEHWKDMRDAIYGITEDTIGVLCNGVLDVTILNGENGFPWWIFTFMACIVLTLLVVTWIAKSDVEKSISSLFCSIFFEIEDKNIVNSAEEILRLWQNGDLGDEDEFEDVPPPPTPVQNSKSHSEESDEDNIFIPTKEEEENNQLDS